jgi:AmmeMemoRadiSam system protein B
MMVAAKNLGATRGELLKYATSGDVTGDISAVVGYSSIVFI